MIIDNAIQQGFGVLKNPSHFHSYKDETILFHIS
jgi:hypothetical protein